MASDAQRAANRKYDAENTVMYCIKLNKKHDEDLIEALEQAATREGGKQGFIKDCLRKCIQ